MTDSPIAKININLGVKICDCFFSAIGCVLALYFLNGFITSVVATVLAIVIIIAAIVFLIVWNYHQDNQKFPSLEVHTWLTAVIRYSVAYTIATYGFAKVLKTQFALLYSRNDTPVGSLSGFDLTWNYFGYSYKLAIILAALQIGGAILLLFRRTTLLGLCVLLPVMMNIVLINIFYSIAIGAFFVSVIITGALFYLLMLNRKALIRVFFYPVDHLPALKLSYFKPVIRLAVLALSFFTIYRYIMDEKPIDFTGKWKVDKLEINGKVLAENAWMTDINAWKNVYVEEHGGIALSPNPYIFDAAVAKRGKFEYDEKNRKLSIVEFKFAKPADSMQITITRKSQQHMEWVGTSKNQRFKMQLTKVPEVKR